MPNLNALANPVAWVQGKLAPKKRVAQERDVAAAQRALEARGEHSLLDAVVDQDRAAPASDAVAAPGTAAGPRKPKAQAKTPKPRPTEHKYSTANFKISPRKLNALGRQISQTPVQHALLQLQFSDKRAAARVRTMLATAERHAVRYKRLDAAKLVVAQAWVTKGPRSLTRIDIRGRGKYGIKRHPDSRLNVILKEGATWEERTAAERARKLSRVRSAGYTREDVPLRNPAPMWAW
jgi:large subunit ribosomal protein L22